MAEHDQEQDQYIPFEDDVWTETKFKSLTERARLPFEGQCRVKITKVVRIQPSADQTVGGDRVYFQVMVAPIGTPEPEGGFPVVGRLFRKFFSPTDGQRKSQVIDDQDKASLVKACGYQPSEEFNIWLALKACEGSEVLMTVVNRKDKNDPETVYQDLKNFRPIG